MLRVAVVVCVLAVSPRFAAALCAAPAIELAPESGAELPPRPRIFAFVPIGHPQGRFTSPQAHLVTFEVATSDAYRIYEIHILAAAGEVTVRYESRRLHRGAEAVYRIGARVPNQAKVVDVDHHATSWTCSFWSFIAFRIVGNAIALRFDWRGADPPPPTFVPADRAALGHLSCIGHTVVIDELRAFDLFALFPDGTERRIGASKLQIGGGVRLPVELVPHLHRDGRIRPVVMRDWHDR